MSGESIHAGLIALHGPTGWRGVLIEGASGSGKSDLALRCLTLGFRLVADDRTLLWTCEGRLFGRAPHPIRDLIEARGLGVLPQPARALAEVWLVVRCLQPAETQDRLPDPASRTLVGVVRPLIAVRPFEASAPQKLIHALSHLGGAA